MCFVGERWGWRPDTVTGTHFRCTFRQEAFGARRTSKTPRSLPEGGDGVLARTSQWPKTLGVCWATAGAASTA